MMDIGKDLKDAYEQGYKDRDAELVRCGECVRKQAWLIDYTHDSDWFCTLHECAMNDNDFCSYGERREP